MGLKEDPKLQGGRGPMDTARTKNREEGEDQMVWVNGKTPRR